MKAHRMVGAVLFCLFLALAWHGVGPATTAALAFSGLDDVAAATSPAPAAGAYYYHPNWGWLYQRHYRYPHYWGWWKGAPGYSYGDWRKWLYPYQYGYYPYNGPGVDVRAGSVAVGVSPGSGVSVQVGGVDVRVGPRIGVRVRIGP